MIDVTSLREGPVARAVNHTVVLVRTTLVSDDDTPVGAMTHSVAGIQLHGRTVALEGSGNTCSGWCRKCAGLGWIARQRRMREQGCCGYPGGSELRIAVRAAGG